MNRNMTLRTRCAAALLLNLSLSVVGCGKEEKIPGAETAVAQPAAADGMPAIGVVDTSEWPLPEDIDLADVTTARDRYPTGELLAVRGMIGDGDEALPHGKTIGYYKTGDRRSEMCFKHGKLHGWLVEWDAEGKLKSKTRYVDGKPQPK